MSAAADVTEMYGASVTPLEITPPKEAQWKMEDFFTMTEDQIIQMKKAIASKLRIHFGDCNQQMEFAESQGGVPAYNISAFTKARERYQTAVSARPDQKLVGEALAANKKTIAQEIEDSSRVVMMVSGSLIRWKPLLPPNIGYVLSWQKKNVPTWDPTLERKASPSADDPAYATFTTTGSSSLLALLAQVVYELKTTKAIPERLAKWYKQIKLNVNFNANADEITMLGQCDNMEQSARKKHTEMDNILAVKSWCTSMEAWKATMKTDVTLDVVRFALCIGDPRDFTVPDWMRELLGNKPPTMANKLNAVSQNMVTKRWLSDKNAKIAHPHLSTYELVAQRHRFIRGFEPIHELYEAVFSKMGLLGLAHQQSPLPKSVLIDPIILNKNGFHAQREKEQVPAWRDGDAGRQLQLRMVTVAGQRYSDYGFAASEQPLFTTGTAWVGFARLIDPITEALQHEYGSSLESWADSLKNFYRELWKGEFDSDLGILALQLPSACDARALQLKVKEDVKNNLSNKKNYFHPQELFRPLARKMAELAVKTENGQMVSAPLEPAAPCRPEIPIPAEALLPGDVTSAFEAGQKLDNAQKAALVAKLNKEAVMERDAAIQKQVHAIAAETFRNRVVVFTQVEEAKAFMETGHAGIQWRGNGDQRGSGRAGLEARTTLVDVTMPKSRQSGNKTRMLCLPPGKELQKSWASAAKMMPSSAIVGHVLVRPALHSLETFNHELRTTHRHIRQITVPIDMPTDVLRHLRSGAKRSSGPVSDDASGLDFVMRTIGRRSTKRPREEASAEAPALDADQEDEDVADDEDAEEEEAGIPGQEALDTRDPATMSTAQLAAAYGSSSAEDIKRIFFQHSSRIGSTAKYLPRSCAVHSKSSETAVATLYRKGQVDPTAFLSAFLSALNATNAALEPHEALVILTGGTAEAIVAGIAAGFRTVIYITEDPAEANMMTLPENSNVVYFPQ